MAVDRIRPDYRLRLRPPRRSRTPTPTPDPDARGTVDFNKLYGTYGGLIEPLSLSFSQSGCVSLSVNINRTFTGKVVIGGVSYVGLRHLCHEWQLHRHRVRHRLQPQRPDRPGQYRRQIHWLAHPIGIKGRQCHG